MTRPIAISVISVLALLGIPALAMSAEGETTVAEDAAVAALPEETAGADQDVDICVLWRDQDEQEIFTDDLVIRRCLSRPGRDECEWEPKGDLTPEEVAMFEAQGYIVFDAEGETSLMAHVDGTMFEVDNVPDECEDLAAAILMGAAGLSTAAKVGIGLGVAAVAILFIDDDDDGQASPVRTGGN